MPKSIGGTKTYWKGEPCPCRRVRVIVGPSQPGWWCNGMQGSIRMAVEINIKSYPSFYIDDEDGSGWRKVTDGRGSPGYGHRMLPVERVLEL